MHFAVSDSHSRQCNLSIKRVVEIPTEEKVYTGLDQEDEPEKYMHTKFWKRFNVQYLPYNVIFKEKNCTVTVCRHKTKKQRFKLEDGVIISPS